MAETDKQDQGDSQSLVFLLKTWLLFVGGVLGFWCWEVLAETSKKGNIESDASTASEEAAVPEKADDLSDSSRPASQNNAESMTELDVALMFIALDPTVQENICRHLAILGDPESIASMILQGTESGRRQTAAIRAPYGDQVRQRDSALNKNQKVSSRSEDNNLSLEIVHSDCQPSAVAVQYMDKACQTDYISKVDEKQTEKSNAVHQVVPPRTSIFKVPGWFKINANVDNVPVDETETPSPSQERFFEEEEEEEEDDEEGEGGEEEEEKEDLDDAPENKAKRSYCSPECLFFNMLPAEIRNLIYHNVLKAVKPIDNAGALVRETASDLVTTDDASSGTLDVDAKLLRTCRRVYKEALPLLYGENTFHFTYLRELKTFRNVGLFQGQPERFCHRITANFNLEPNPNGRVSMIRKLSLKLSVRSIRRESREEIIAEWQPFIRQDRHDPLVGSDFFEFPSLEDLALDFSDWGLQKHERLVTRPFIEKFRGAEGLRKVVIKAVSHEQSLEQLKGLLKEGGEFVSILDN